MNVQRLCWTVLLSPLIVSAACGPRHVQRAAPPQPIAAREPTPAGEATPRVITDLSSLSPSGAAHLRAAPPVVAPPIEPERARRPEESSATQANLNRLFLDKPASEHSTGTSVDPGGERLLNDKAARLDRKSVV